MRKFTTKDLTLAAMVAALYAVMSYFGNVFGLTYGPIQLRFSEALCVLPFLFPATAPGLYASPWPGATTTAAMTTYPPWAARPTAIPPSVSFRPPSTASAPAA